MYIEVDWSRTLSTQKLPQNQKSEKETQFFQKFKN